MDWAKLIIVILVAAGLAALYFNSIHTAAPSPTPSLTPVLSPSPAASPIDLQKQCDISLSAALTAGNSGLCDKITCVQTRSYCMGLLTRDAASCENAGSRRDDCYASLAVQTRKTLFCDKISDAGKKNYCIAEVSMNPFYCNGISFVPSKDACLQYIARNLKNATICEGITDEVIKKSCVGLTK